MHKNLTENLTEYLTKYSIENFTQNYTEESTLIVTKNNKIINDKKNSVNKRL